SQAQYGCAAGARCVREVDRGYAAAERCRLWARRSQAPAHLGFQSGWRLPRCITSDRGTRMAAVTRARARCHIRPAVRAQQYADCTISRVAAADRQSRSVFAKACTEFQSGIRCGSDVPQHPLRRLGWASLRLRLQSDARSRDRGWVAHIKSRRGRLAHPRYCDGTPLLRLHSRCRKFMRWANGVRSVELRVAVHPTLCLESSALSAISTLCAFFLLRRPETKCAHAPFGDRCVRSLFRSCATWHSTPCGSPRTMP